GRGGGRLPPGRFGPPQDVAEREDSPARPALPRRRAVRARDREAAQSQAAADVPAGEVRAAVWRVKRVRDRGASRRVYPGGSLERYIHPNTPTVRPVTARASSPRGDTTPNPCSADRRPPPSARAAPTGPRPAVGR